MSVKLTKNSDTESGTARILYGYHHAMTSNRNQSRHTRAMSTIYISGTVGRFGYRKIDQNIDTPPIEVIFYWSTGRSVVVVNQFVDKTSSFTTVQFSDPGTASCGTVWRSRTPRFM